MSMFSMPQPKIKRISEQEAYELICKYNADFGGRDSISARGWLRYASYLRGEYMYLTNGRTIKRYPNGKLNLITEN